MSEKQLSIVEHIDKTQERFHKIAPKHIRFDAEKGFALSLLNNNQYLMAAAQSNPASLVQAVASIAATGLSLNPAERQAYLITRNVKVGDKQWQTRVFLEPSYMGLCKLSTDSGAIKWVQASCVYKNDEFTDNGPGERPTHKYSPFASREDRGDFVGVYCVAKTSEGDYLTTIMPAEKVISIRDRSEAWKAKAAGRSKHGGPWESDFEEMAKKAVIRQAFKTWPRSDGSRLAEAVHISNENEGFEPILTQPNMGQYTAEQKEYFDRLIESGDALEMYVFQRTLDNESLFTNLYHSFEKGTKGKYQRAIDEMLSKGHSIIADYIDALSQGVQDGDDAAIQELVGELSQDALELVLSRCDAATVAEIKRIIQEKVA